jgi:hypothetical protein
MALLGQWAVATNFSMILGPTLSEATSDPIGMGDSRDDTTSALPVSLALFALGLQLFASFAHVRPEGALRPYDISLSGATSPGRLSTDAPNSPAGGPHDDCAICLTVGLLGSALSGEPPAVPHPMTVNPSWQSAGIEKSAQFRVMSDSLRKKQ